MRKSAQHTARGVIGPAAIALLFLAAGCGGSVVASAAHGQASAAATATPLAAPQEPTAHPYSTPMQMLAKVHHFGWLNGCSKKPAYNVYGSLFIVCNGRMGETVYLDTFDAQSIGRSIQSSHVDAAAHYYVGPGWLVSAYNQQSLSQLVAALR